MFYTPAKVGDMWDPYVLWHAGEFHMIHMVGTNDADYSHRAMCMARSVDGVHWEDLGVIADGREPGIPIFAVGARFAVLAVGPVSASLAKAAG